MPPSCRGAAAAGHGAPGGGARRRGPGAIRVLATLLAMGPLIVPPVHASVRIKRGGEVDLLLVGYAVFQTNLSEQLESFFDTSDQLPAEFTNRQLLNLRMDGHLSKDVTIDARLLHDRESVRDWRYLLRVAGERNLIGIGELEGAFRETQFTRYDTPYYGLEARLGLGKLTASGFGTARDGSFRVDRLRGSNLSGPYILTASPILEGSERVAIEVRDRRDDEKVLSSDAKERGRDYTIDYGTGTIVFNEPIETETFDGDPVLVVVDYQAATATTGETSLLVGTRLQFEPWKGLRLGSTYLRSTGSEDTALAKEGVLGFDQAFAVGKWLQGEGEMAGPSGNFLNAKGGAMRFQATVKPLPQLEVSGRFRRVGSEFDTTVNPRLDSDRDREEWEIDTSFLVTKGNRLTAGYGQKTDNIANDPALARTRVRSFFAGWEEKMHGWPALRLRYEKRMTDGTAEFGGGVTDLDSVTLDVESGLGEWGRLGKAALKTQVRFEDASDGGIVADSRRTYAARTRLDLKHSSKLDTSLEARYSLTRGEGGTPTDSHTTELLGGVRYRLGPTFAAGASLRWRRNSDEVGEGSVSDRTTALLDVRWEPSPRFRGLLKYEWVLSSATGAEDGQTRNLFAQGSVVPFKGLTASFGYKLDDRGGELAGGQGGLDGEYFVSMLYKGGGCAGKDCDPKEERITLFAKAERGRSEERLPPFESTLSERLTWVFGSSVEVTAKWGVLAQLKDERLQGAVAAHRRALVLELSRKVSKMLKLAGGFEVVLDEQGDVSRFDRQRIYLKLIGRL